MMRSIVDWITAIAIVGFICASLLTMATSLPGFH